MFSGVTEQPGEINDIVSSDDEMDLVDTSRRAIDSPEEDRKIMLNRVKGTTVMRRQGKTCVNEYSAIVPWNARDRVFKLRCEMDIEKY